MTKKGRIVSFSGIDGAGKSTQVKLFSQYLKSKKKNFIATEKMFTYFLLGPLVKILRKSTGSPSGGPVRRNKRILPKFWSILAFIDIWLGYIFDILPLLFKYDIVIADRFYVDIWANLLYYGYLPKWAFGLVKFLPRADSQFLFEVKPGTVRKREDDFPLKYYEEQSKIYKHLSKLGNFQVLDANMSPKKVSSEIIKRTDL